MEMRQEQDAVTCFETDRKKKLILLVCQNQIKNRNDLRLWSHAVVP